MGGTQEDNKTQGRRVKKAGRKGWEWGSQWPIKAGRMDPMGKERGSLHPALDSACTQRLYTDSHKITHFFSSGLGLSTLPALRIEFRGNIKIHRVARPNVAQLVGVSSYIPKSLQFRFPVRAHTKIAVQYQVRVPVGSNQQMFLSRINVSPSPNL